MMWRYADGTLSLGFWYAAAVALLMVASGVWGLVAPASFRAFYFNLLRRLRRVGVGRRATTNQLVYGFAPNWDRVVFPHVHSVLECRRDWAGRRIHDLGDLLHGSGRRLLVLAVALRLADFAVDQPSH